MDRDTPARVSAKTDATMHTRITAIICTIIAAPFRGLSLKGCDGRRLTELYLESNIIVFIADYIWMYGKFGAR